MAPTQHQIDAADAARRERAADAFAERMASFDAGLVSLAAVHAGGARYAKELAESALELREATGIAEPVAVALAGWLASVSVRKVA